MIGLRLPRRLLLDICPMTVANPAHSGAPMLVPPIQQEIAAVPLLLLAQKAPGDRGLAMSAISGTSRALSLGTPGPVWNEGLGKIWLAPPPDAPLPSSHTLSVW